jgi:hypothetical protein
MADGQPDGLATGEAIRAGLTEEDAAGRDVPALSSAGQLPGDGAASAEDIFNTGAISELAGAADGAAAAAAPF